MQWYRAHIRKHGVSIGEASATTLQEALRAAHRHAGTLEGMKVYCRANDHADFTYYLSPVAASLIKDHLISYNAEPCEPPSDLDLDGFWEVSL